MSNYTDTAVTVILRGGLIFALGVEFAVATYMQYQGKKAIEKECGYSDIDALQYALYNCWVACLAYERDFQKHAERTGGAIPIAPPAYYNAHREGLKERLEDAESEGAGSAMGHLDAGVAAVDAPIPQKSFHLLSHCPLSMDFPYWCALYDPYGRHLYITFRGTTNCTDMLIDAAAELSLVETSRGCFFAHSGVLNAMMAKYGEIRSSLQSYVEEHDVARVTFTGHSLGGAYAILFYLLVMGSPGAVPTEVPVDCYTFGAPAVVSPDGGDANALPDPYFAYPLSEYESGVHNFVHNFDIVPRLLGHGGAVKAMNALSVVLEGTRISTWIAKMASTNFVQNSMAYIPYGEFYFLSTSSEKTKVLKAHTIEHKTTIMRLPVGLARPTRLINDHFLVGYDNRLSAAINDIMLVL